MNNVLAAQLFTVREFTKTPEDIKNTMKKIADIGYTAVQVSGMGPIDPKELKKMTDDNNLKIIATHNPYNRFFEDLDALVEEHLLWNCDCVGIGSLPQDMRTEEGYREFVKQFNVVGKKLKEHNLNFVYHNHAFEFTKYGDKTGFDIFIDESDKDVFKFIPDSYWIQAGGENPAEFLKRMDNRAPVVHLKDMQIDEEGKKIICEVGQGIIDFKAFVKASFSVGAKWLAVEQDRCSGDPFVSLKMSYDYCVENLGIR